MSKLPATTSDLTLAALLYRLRQNGWTFVDVDKLTDVYETFQSRTGTVLYGTALNCSRAAIRRELEDDLISLEELQQIQRSVSRVQLTPNALPIVAQLEIHEYLKRLIATADEIFPPKDKP